MSNSEKALQMHEQWNGKLETTAKAHVNSREDLAIAYTPGVAEPCKVIAKDPEAAYKYTIKSNTVAVVSDGSAVLGLGNIGALAAMPVMEGKAVLPGETVEIHDGQIFIDGSKTPLKDVTTKEFMQGSFGPYTVPDNCYFVMGDNRNNSKDSRYWEHTFVTDDEIVGKAFLRYWPLNKIKFL